MTDTQNTVDMELTTDEAASILDVLGEEVNESFQCAIDVASSKSGSKRSTPTDTTTPATKRHRTIPSKTGITNKKTEEKKVERKKKEDVAYVSVVAIPKASRKTNKVRDMYREMVRIGETTGGERGVKEEDRGFK